VAEFDEIGSGLQLAAMLNTQQRQSLLRAIARLIVEREIDDERIANARNLGRGKDKGRHR
jgi:hypothetical protein